MATNIKFYKKNTKPSSGVQGGVYFIKNEGKIYIYNNGWEDYVVTADKLAGFSTRSTSLNWGALSGQTVATRLATSTGGEIAFTNSGDKLNCQIDGCFYQNEGNYKVVDQASMYEAYLRWGGKNWSGDFGPIDAAMVPELGANRLAFLPKDDITVEYSTDGGNTWATYTLETEWERLFCPLNCSNPFYIGNRSTAKIDKSKDQLRITITSAHVYTQLVKFAIYVSTNGSEATWCTITGRTHTNVAANKDEWKVFAEKQSVGGWGGWNVINVSGLTTYSWQTSHYENVRFTFGTDNSPETNTYGGLVVYTIMGFGGVGWNTPSNMATTGHIYYNDTRQNTFFPKNIMTFGDIESKAMIASASGFKKVNSTNDYVLLGAGGTAKISDMSVSTAKQLTWEEYK